MTTTPPILIIHDTDADGKMAAILFYYLYKPEVPKEFRGMRISEFKERNSTDPYEGYSEIVILDLAVSDDFLWEMLRLGGPLTLIDHHPRFEGDSSLAPTSGRLTVKHNTNKSTTLLAWEYLMPLDTLGDLPLDVMETWTIVNAVDDCDLWEGVTLEKLAISQAVEAFDLTKLTPNFGIWSLIWGQVAYSGVTPGNPEHAALTRIAQRVKTDPAPSDPLLSVGSPTVAIYCSGASKVEQNWLAHCHLQEYPETSVVAICEKIFPNGLGKWSFRSRKGGEFQAGQFVGTLCEFDESWSGGGHAHAAGAILALDWPLILQNEATHICPAGIIDWGPEFIPF